MSDSKAPAERDTNRVTAVTSAPLGSGIGVTLVRDANGWRFSAWHSENLSAPPTLAVNDADRERYFKTAADAAAYFKQTYASLLRAR